MIGVTISLGEKANKVKGIGYLKESWHFYKDILSTNNVGVSYIGYDGYPVNYWEHSGNTVIVEGIIYNICDDDIKANLNNIIEKGYNQDLIREFIKKADGDFIVYFVNEKNNEVVAFNDILGGLPLFYSSEGNTLFLSRQFGLIAQNLNERQWNKENIAEYLSFGYNLRQRTFLSSVYKFEPASILFASFDKKVNVEYNQLYVDDFIIENRYKNEDEAAIELAKLLVESCHNRVNYARTHGYKIVNTMSGGFDSRTVLGVIEKDTDSYVNITYEYVTDESQTAQDVLSAMGSKSEYVKLSFKNTPDLYDTRLTLNTDGRINAFTNSICYHDMLSVRKHLGEKKILYFGGFGGEFIRHPRYETLLPLAVIGLTYSPTYYLTSKICNTTVDNLKTVFHDSFDNKKSREQRFKDFYNEYYQNLVRCSGEDRTRMFYFTVQPMMGKDFIMAIRHKVPLNWVGFSFYKKFLKEIDERLLSIDIHGEKEGFLNDSNLKKKDFKRKVFEYFYSSYRYLNQRFSNRELRKVENTLSFDDIAAYFEVNNGSQIFNQGFIKNNYSNFDITLKYRLIAILSYISKIENYK